VIEKFILVIHGECGSKKAEAPTSAHC